MEPVILKRLDGYPPHSPAGLRPLGGLQTMGGEVEAAGTWTAHSYADELLARGQYPHVRVQCGCGRTRPAFAVIDVRALPPDIRGSAEWACDACVWEWQTREPDSIGTPDALAAHLGAPDVAVAVLRRSDDA